MSHHETRVRSAHGGFYRILRVDGGIIIAVQVHGDDDPARLRVAQDDLLNLAQALLGIAGAKPVAWRYRFIYGSTVGEWQHCGEEPKGENSPNFQKEPLYAALGVAAQGEGQAPKDGGEASDHWQQYAKEGETAQACIERHRREMNGLLKLLAQAREPLTDEQIIALLPPGWTGMLAQVMEFARRIQAARGVAPSHEDTK